MKNDGLGGRVDVVLFWPGVRLSWVFGGCLGRRGVEGWNFKKAEN